MRQIPIFVLVLAVLVSNDAFAASHPLDPLSAGEIRAAVDALWKAGRVDKTSRFAIVKLAEPDKQTVLAWTPGDPLPRRAFAAVRHERKLFETVIDIDRKSIDSWQQIADAQPAQIADEWMLSQQIVRKDEGFRAAVRERGIKDLKSLVCVPSLPGYFGQE